MNLLKIAILLKRRFSEFYDVKQYRMQASEQLVVRKYTVNNQKIIIDEEK